MYGLKHPEYTPRAVVVPGRVLEARVTHVRIPGSASDPDAVVAEEAPVKCIVVCRVQRRSETGSSDQGERPAAHSR